MVHLKDGCFREGRFSAIPYQHFETKSIWEVLVWEVLEKKKDEEESPPEAYIYRKRICSLSALEAAKKAIQAVGGAHKKRSKDNEGWQGASDLQERPKRLRRMGFSEHLLTGEI